MPYLETPMTSKNYNLTSSSTVYVTSENGDKISLRKNVTFKSGDSNGNVIKIYPDQLKQTMDGIGTSFTESSAFVLAHLEPQKRSEVMHQIFSEEGANFTLTRTHIASCDFCVEGKYSYAEVKDDTNLSHFDIGPDHDGFSIKKYPGIEDESFDLLPMILEAQEIKNNQASSDLHIIASAWTAPPWMKDIEDWYERGDKSNNYNGTGGVLKPKYEETFANYIIKYIEAYKQKGVKLWGVTPVNEPLGNNGQWESMHFSPESQSDFIKNHLGPKLHESGNKDLQLLMFDHARDQLEQWADVIYNDVETSKYVDGAAVHWYESTFKVYEDVFDSVHDKYPEYSIIHTEGCIDDLGKVAPEGVSDPEGFKEKNWFKNDSFWWNDNATDWGYTVPWAGVKTEDHPIYSPVHRYARNIIVSINHWLSGWIDWNIVLDKNGGPNHVGNFCGAPIMIDTDSSYVYYTPVFYILAQLSRSIRPGDIVVNTEMLVPKAFDDSIYSCATVNKDKLLSVQLLNVEKQDIEMSIQIGEQYAAVLVGANSLQTISVQM
ncbi:MAG: glucosylceramidase [Cocleimonas sp.]|jgi:glucosylceramidase